jgi:hypothetical protein
MSTQRVHPSESNAAAVPVTVHPVAALMAGHVLRDGELVLLMLRPSRWFILLSSLKFLAIVIIAMVLAIVFGDKLHQTRNEQPIEAAVLLMVGRLMWGVLQWYSRLYVLTDMRILSLSGVFNIDVFECPLRKVARIMRETTFKERVCRVGSIAIIPQDESMLIGHWQMVPRPRQVYERIVSAVSKAKQNGLGGVG